MNKLKEINDKYYQEAEVLMLDSNNKSYFGFLTKKGKDVFNDLRYFSRKMPQILDSVNQHLYFLSNREITCGDWFYNTTTRTIHKCTEVNNNICSGKNSGEYHGKFECKKIIATTDESLVLCNNTAFAKLLPQPSHEFILAFIKAYNEGKPITKVLVEMEEYGEELGCDPAYYGLDSHKLKINSSNEITIKKVKDSYTREEVIQILVDYSNNVLNQKYRGNTAEVINQFIEENL